MTSGHPSRRPGGRTARNTEAIRAATLAVLLERGADGFTVHEVAERAGVNASTIHRRWGSRANVLFDALLDAVGAAIPIPDTGSVADDVRALLEGLLDFYGTPLGAVVGALSMAPLVDPEAESVRRQMWRQRIEDASVIVRRGQERGEVHAGVDPLAATEFALAPLHLRLLTLGTPPEQCHIPELTEMVMEGLGRRDV